MLLDQWYFLVDQNLWGKYSKFQSSTLSFFPAPFSSIKTCINVGLGIAFMQDYHNNFQKIREPKGIFRYQGPEYLAFGLIICWAFRSRLRSIPLSNHQEIVQMSEEIRYFSTDHTVTIASNERSRSKHSNNQSWAYKNMVLHKWTKTQKPLVISPSKGRPNTE